MESPTTDAAVETPAADTGTATGGDDLLRLQRLLESAVPKSTPAMLTDIRDPAYRLTRPLPVTLEHEGDAVVATAYDVDMFGEGEDPQAALDDLCDGLLEYYEYLQDHAPALGTVPTRDWRILQDLIRPATDGR